MNLPTIRPARAAAVSAAAIVALVGSTKLAQAIDEPRVAQQGGRSIAAAAPCSGSARISLRMSDSPSPRGPVRLRVTATGARPGSVWELSIHTYEGDDGGVGTYPRQRADERGTWTVRGSGLHGYVEVKVFATSRGGQSCEVQLEGRVGS